MGCDVVIFVFVDSDGVGVWVEDVRSGNFIKKKIVLGVVMDVELVIFEFYRI